MTDRLDRCRRYHLGLEVEGVRRSSLRAVHRFFLHAGGAEEVRAWSGIASGRVGRICFGIVDDEDRRWWGGSSRRVNTRVERLHVLHGSSLIRGGGRGRQAGHGNTVAHALTALARRAWGANIEYIAGDAMQLRGGRNVTLAGLAMWRFEVQGKGQCRWSEIGHLDTLMGPVLTHATSTVAPASAL